MAGRRSLAAFFDELVDLGEVDRGIVLLISRKGRVTAGQLERVLGLSSPALEDALNRLVEKKLVRRSRSGYFEFFEIPLQRYSVMRRELFPAGPVIPLVYQYNLLCDVNRMDGFRAAIEQTVQAGDIVLDLGCGTGVMAMWAAAKGAYVYAVEVDGEVAEAAEFFIKQSGFDHRIRIFHADAREITLPQRATVCICEMLDTALITELQVPVLNYAWEHLVEPSCRVVPRETRTFVELVYGDYKFADLELNLPFFEAYGARPAVGSLSEKLLYHVADFRRLNDVAIHAEVTLVAIASGVANALRISTETFASESIRLSGSTWLNPPLMLPIKPLQVRERDRIVAGLRYELGGGLSSLEYTAWRRAENVSGNR